MRRHLMLVSSLMFCVPILDHATDKQISSQELAGHKTTHDCWMAIDGVVYNMTDYMKLHEQTCKEMQLNEYCGKDASDVWKQAEEKHKRKSLMQLERSKVGRLSGT